MTSDQLLEEIAIELERLSAVVSEVVVLHRDVCCVHNEYFSLLGEDS